MQKIILSRHLAQTSFDLNDLRIFAYVATLASFSSAAEALQIHKSSVSRSIARLEAMLETSLIQRTTRRVLLTPCGFELKERCIELISRVNETIDSVGGLTPARDSAGGSGRPTRLGSGASKPLRTRAGGAAAGAFHRAA